MQKEQGAPKYEQRGTVEKGENKPAVEDLHWFILLPFPAMPVPAPGDTRCSGLPWPSTAAPKADALRSKGGGGPMDPVADWSMELLVSSDCVVSDSSTADGA